MVMEFFAQILEHCGLDSPDGAFARSWLLPLEQGVESALAHALEPHEKMRARDAAKFRDLRRRVLAFGREFDSQQPSFAPSVRFAGVAFINDRGHIGPPERKDAFSHARSYTIRALLSSYLLEMVVLADADDRKANAASDG